MRKILGNTADIGVLSFDFGKTITTGGGMILTNNKLILIIVDNIMITDTKI